MRNDPIAVGFYGKLPSHGDFLRRRTSDAFMDAWDAWLQEAISVSRGALGDRWLEVYLTSPVWRFAGAPGVCGPAAIAGVMVPSVDRVGRYFPLTIVGELPGHVNPLEIAIAADAYYQRAEQVAIETLEAEEIDFNAFDHNVDALRDLLEPLCAPGSVTLDPLPQDALDAGLTGLQFSIPSAPQLGSALLQMLAHHLAGAYEPLMLWWTDGSAAVQPEGVVSQGLPHPDSFAAMLDGSRAERHWAWVPAQIAAIDPSDTVIPESPPLQYRSAARSHVGKVRSINQDSYIERTEVGIWVVADGLGGHSDGEVASRMVCDGFADLTPTSTFEELIEAASERVQLVNEELNRVAERSLLGVRCGSTVVALLARGARLAVLSAGDSRVYRWRNAQLEQLTQDHSLAAEEGAEGAESNVVTRAVGGEATLLLDVVREQGRAGDRYLLCSDGLTRVLPVAEIERWLKEAEPEAVAEGLVAETLEAGAPDNVTVLVVDAAAQ